MHGWAAKTIDKRNLHSDSKEAGQRCEIGFFMIVRYLVFCSPLERGRVDCAAAGVCW
jgi:hypothetical protein